MTRLVTKADIQTSSTSVDYGSGLDLMTYEGSTVSTFVKKGVSSVVSTSNPDQSLLLRKTVSGGGHAGGAFWNDRAPDYIAISRWISEGALKNQRLILFHSGKPRKHAKDAKRFSFFVHFASFVAIHRSPIA